MIDKKLRSEPLARSDPRFADAVRYMDWASEDFEHKFVVEGDEVLVTAREARPRVAHTKRGQPS